MALCWYGGGGDIWGVEPKYKGFKKREKTFALEKASEWSSWLKWQDYCLKADVMPEVINPEKRTTAGPKITKLLIILPFEVRKMCYFA